VSALAAALLALVGVAGDAGLAAERVRAELHALGYEVRRLDAFEPADPLEGAIDAVVRVDVARHRVEVWTPERAGAGAATRFRTAVVAGADEGDELLGVRAAEAVRAYLSEKDARPPEVAAPLPPDLAPAPRAVTTPLSASVDAAVLLHTDGPTPAGALFLRGRYAVARRWSVGALAALPIVPALVHGDAGTATVSATAAGPELAFDVIGEPARWRAAVSAGLAAVWLRMDGTAQPPFVSARDDVWTALPFAGAEASFALTPRLSLRASGLLGAAAPAVTVRFADVPVTRWGSPLVAGAFGLAVTP
jgi:hypothetical protein